MPSCIKLWLLICVEYTKPHYMRPFLLIVFILTSFLLHARERSKPYLARSCQEYSSPVYDSTIKDIHRSELGSKVVVRYHDKKVIKYPCDHVWGYMGRDGVGYRTFAGEFYRITQVDTLTIYERRIRSGKIRKRVSYFSKGLAGDIHKLTQRQLKEVYGQNPAFLSSLHKELKWYQDLNSYSNKQRSYRIITLYKKAIS